MSVAKIVGRRFFARMAALAPAVVPQIRHVHTDAYHGGFPPPGFPGVGETAAEVAENKIRSSIWDALRAFRRQEYQRTRMGEARRSLMGGFDPDLGVLHSMSHQHRALRQAERILGREDREKDKTISIAKFFGGKPEEFT